MGLPKGAVLLLRLLTGFIRMFVLDSRSLALFRVWIGATTISDVMTRFPDAHHHYSDSGMFPREFILKSFTNHYWITLHMLSGTEFVMQCLFIVEIIIAFLLLVGYRTRTMTILSWIMVCSVQNRNYVLGHSGDTVHRLFLFVAIFLPLSRVFSVDRVLECLRSSRDCDDLDRDREREKRRLGLAGLTSSSPANGSSSSISNATSSPNCAKYEIVNFATALFIVQLLVMYYMAHHHKTGAEWREKGIAAWMALQLDYFRTWFGDLLLIWTPGLIFGNYAVLAWQYWGSVMYFSPIFNKYFRALTCLGFTAMHVGFGMAFYLETFTWATLAACSGIIPSWVWDLAIKYISNLPIFKPIQIHVTSKCKTCLFVARLLDEFSLPGKSKIIIASSRFSPSSSCLCNSKCSHGSRFLGIAVLDQNKNWIQGPAALSAIAKNSPILYPLHFILRIPFVQKTLSFVSYATHSHNIDSSNSDSAMEEATIDSSKFSYHPHFESFEKFEKLERDTKKDDDILALPRNEEFAGVLVDSPNINTNTGKSKKEIFEVQSASYNWTDVKEASKIGLTAGKEIFVALLLFLVITCNAGHLNTQYGVPPPLQPVLWMFQLDQYWGMFAPRPPDMTWWYNFEGYLDDGTHVELFNDGALHSFSPNIPHTFDKPNIHDSIGNHRWFKLFENGLNSHSNREEIRLYFGRWFCREYNSRNRGTQRVHKYSIHFMYERLNMEKMDGSRFPPARETIWNHLCYDKETPKN